MAGGMTHIADDHLIEPAVSDDSARLEGIIAFLQAAEQLKDTLRSGITTQGRPESTAEHSWRLCLMAMLFDRELGEYDRLKLLKLCIVHDLGEAISGDVPATRQVAGAAGTRRPHRTLRPPACRSSRRNRGALGRI